jgi:hypothetical protein
MEGTAVKVKGITNAQASYLSALQRAAGEQYSGSGMSAAQASAEIQRLVDVRPHLLSWGNTAPYWRKPENKARHVQRRAREVAAPYN